MHTNNSAGRTKNRIQTDTHARTVFSVRLQHVQQLFLQLNNRQTDDGNTARTRRRTELKPSTRTHCEVIRSGDGTVMMRLTPSGSWRRVVRHIETRSAALCVYVRSRAYEHTRPCAHAPEGFKDPPRYTHEPLRACWLGMQCGVRVRVVPAHKRACTRRRRPLRSHARANATTRRKGRLCT